jgi:hypothetical protein
LESNLGRVSKYSMLGGLPGNTQTGLPWVTWNAGCRAEP